MAYNILIASVDRTADVVSQSVVVEDVANDEQNNCSFDLVDLSETGIPSTDDEIIITLADDTISGNSALRIIARAPNNEQHGRMREKMLPGKNQLAITESVKKDAKPLENEALKTAILKIGDTAQITET